jgi:hypothetical protein
LVPQLAALEKLFLDENEFGHNIEVGALSGLAALKELELQDAGIASLSQGIFVEVSDGRGSEKSPPTNSWFIRPHVCFVPQLMALEELSLYGNDFGANIEAGAFAGLTALKRLYLSSAGITSLPQGLFAEVRGASAATRARKGSRYRRLTTVSSCDAVVLAAVARPLVYQPRCLRRRSVRRLPELRSRQRVL